MRPKMLIFCFFICFVTVNSYSLGGRDKGPDQIAPRQDIEGDIAELKTYLKNMQENTDKKFEAIDRRFEAIDRRLGNKEPDDVETNNDTRVSPPKPSPPPPYGGKSHSASHRPVISGETPVMAANRESNYLEPSAVVEFLNRFHGVSRSTIAVIVGQYIDEAEALGINHDIAIAQMCHATEFLTNNLWRTNNYANLNKDGVIWNGKSWNGTFPDGSRQGVKAHIMHLRGYASDVPGHLEGERVDPRFHKLATMRGQGNTLHKLCGFWAGKEPMKYENNLKAILKTLYDFQDSYN